jgi:hypothetical protein
MKGIVLLVLVESLARPAEACDMKKINLVKFTQAV